MCLFLAITVAVVWFLLGLIKNKKKLGSGTTPVGKRPINKKKKKKNKNKNVLYNYTNYILRLY